MSVIGDRSASTNTTQLLNDLERHNRANSDSLSKLSSGQVFTAQDPRPTERAIAEGLEFKLRSLSSAKQNINDGVSLLQTAEGGFNEISNMLIRMKEINVAGASSTISDRERKFLFIEYQALHKEIDRIASSTEYNGIPLLNGKDERTPERMILRLGDPTSIDEKSNLNEIRFEKLKDIVATTIGLGLKPVSELLGEDSGVAISDALDLLAPDDSRFGTIYDQALDQVANYRAEFGAMQTRLERAKDYNDVAFENISAAKSKIADTDYAQEVSKLTQTSMLMQTATALLTQNNLAARLGVNLVNSLLN
jgi:flagellin